MSNLLPIPSMKEVARMHKARFLFVAAGLLAGAGVAAAVILLPSYLIVEKYNASLESEITSLSAPAADAADRELIKHIQSRVDQIKPFVGATSTPSGIIADALALRPKDLLVDHISYSIGKTTSILLAGSSQKGGVVSVYQRALTASDRFSGVSVPVGALAGVDNGQFSITITAK